MSDGVTFLWALNGWPDFIKLEGKRGDYETYYPAETCEDVGHYCFTCSKCGWTANEPRHAFGGFWPKFCPECGAKVVGE